MKLVRPGRILYAFPRSAICLRTVSHSALNPTNVQPQMPQLVAKTTFIENYLLQELAAFKRKYLPLSSASNSESHTFPFSTHSQVEVEILDVINSGKTAMLFLGSVGVGILDHKSRWLVLVPLSLPGEKIIARITANGPGVSTARLVSILSPSKKRESPRCEYFGRCNGCNLQHISYKDQLAQKEQSIKSIFANMAPYPHDNVFRPILASPLEFGFRNKFTPHFNRPRSVAKGTICKLKSLMIANIGFNDVEGKVIDIESCAVADARINESYQKVRQMFHEKWKSADDSEPSNGITMLFRRRVQVTQAQVSLLDPTSLPKEKIDIVIGNGPDFICSEVIDNFKFTYAACNFFQTNPAALSACIRVLRKELKECYPHLTNLMDLYCGVGLFALLLQSQFTKIVGIESDKRAIHFARENSKNIPGENRLCSNTIPIRFLAGDSAYWVSNPKVVSFLPANKTVVILDPPRAGCSDSLISGLLSYRPQLIVYISCYPLTQAADISKLLSVYSVKMVQPMDFFPQTHHVENMTLKAGFSGDNFPAASIPTIVGVTPCGEKKILGTEALNGQDSLSISHPMQGGVIRSWDDMVLLWEHALDSIGVSGDNSHRKILQTESTLTSSRAREQMVEISLERFGFGHVYLALQGVLALYSQGLVVDIGEGVTDIFPVVDGFALPHAAKRVDVSGRDISRYLMKLLSTRGYTFNKPSDLELVRMAKESLCYIGYGSMHIYPRYDISQEKKLAAETVALEKKFTLPDGRSIVLGPERFEAPEALFTPDLLDVETGGLAAQVFASIMATDVDIRPQLYGNILLAGGSSLFPGLVTRLESEIKNLYLERILKGDASRMDRLNMLKIIDPPTRLHSVFQGGALLASIMQDNDDFWISRKEWEEYGSSMLKKLGPK